MDFLNKIKQMFFSSGTPKAESEPVFDINNLIKFKVVVVEFADNIESRSGEIIAQNLKKQEGLEVSYFDEPFSKSFLNLDNRTLFDLIDKGLNIIDHTHADVLIWGYQEGEKIRINFQNSKQYEKDDKAFISLVDSFYIPANLNNSETNFPPALNNLIYGGVICAINPQTKEAQIQKKFLLKKIIHSLSQDNSAKSLSIEYMPYIMNLLGIIYLSYAYDRGDGKDYKIVKKLFDSALEHKDLIKNPIHLGCIYNHLGQLYDSSSEYSPKQPFNHLKNAISYFRQAQKYLSKYNYPYDYGYISYRLSQLFYTYWRQKEDIQALRDAVFQLREAEKIYTYALFPEFWSNIQGELAHMLSLLGSFSNSEDISELAIASYKNRQKVITEKRDPLEWAHIQTHIGEIYYRLGKNNQDKALLEEALDYFHDALYIYENMGLEEEIKKISSNIAKTSHNLNFM